MRIGTWNVEYADVAATDERRQEILAQNDADIWALTETHDSLAPTDQHQPVHSDQRPLHGRRVRAGSRWVSIWTRYPIIERVMAPNADTERTVALRTEEERTEWLTAPTQDVEVIQARTLPTDADRVCRGLFEVSI